MPPTLGHDPAATPIAVVLGGPAAHQHRDLAEIRGLHAGSPTMRTSVCSTTPFIW